MTKKLKSPVKKLTKETPVKKFIDKVEKEVKEVKAVKEENVTKEVEVKQGITPKPVVDGVAQDQLMQDVLELVSATFNIKKDFVVTAFTDGGSKCSITFNNKEFEVSVKCKSLFQLGLRD